MSEKVKSERTSGSISANTKQNNNNKKQQDHTNTHIHPVKKKNPIFFERCVQFVYTHKTSMYAFLGLMLGVCVCVCVLKKQPFIYCVLLLFCMSERVGFIHLMVQRTLYSQSTKRDLVRTSLEQLNEKKVEFQRYGVGGSAGWWNWNFSCFQVYALTFIAIITSVGNAAVLLVFRPVVLARQTETVVRTCCTSGRTGHALLSLFVTVKPIRTAIQAFSFVRETPRPARYALRFRRTVTGQTRHVTRCTAETQKRRCIR